jgi:hypothetical protein
MKPMFKEAIMKKHLAGLASLLGAILALSANPAAARTTVDINIGIPAPVYVRPAPVYVEPAPVYVQPRPVYVESRPVYVESRPVYVESRSYYHPRHKHSRHRHSSYEWRDQDRDGIANRYDRDMDGDGVPNRRDHNPNNPYYR